MSRPQVPIGPSAATSSQGHICNYGHKGVLSFLAHRVQDGKLHVAGTGTGGSAIGFLKERSFFTGELFTWLLPQVRANGLQFSGIAGKTSSVRMIEMELQE